MDYLRLVVMFEHYLMVALFAVGFVLQLWAFFDAMTRSADAFLRAGLRQKSFWLMLTGAALGVGAFSLYMSFLYGGGMQILGVAALCIAGVYLAGPRREMSMYSGGYSY